MAQFQTQTQAQNWQCPICSNKLGELNAWCEYCFYENETKVFNPDKYFVREIRVFHLSNRTAKPMTPQEELYVSLYNDYKTNPTVQAMNDLELRAHREQLSKIALEAKASMSAVDDILRERKPKGIQGFSKSLNSDDTTSNAINTLKERKTRMSKADKVKEELKKLYELSGSDSASAVRESETRMSAGKILEQIKNKESIDKTAENIIKGNEIRSPLSQENGFTLIREQNLKNTSTPVTEKKPFINPFEKK